MAFGLSTTQLTIRGNLRRASDRLDSSMEKLSSGLRINRAADDVAGLSVSEDLKTHTRMLSRAKLNANDGISLLETAEDGVSEIEQVLGDMKDLAQEAANSGTSASRRQELNDQFKDLQKELGQIATNTEYNDQRLLNGSYSGTFMLGNKAADSIDLALSKAMDKLFVQFSAVIDNPDGNVGSDFIQFSGGPGASHFSFDTTDQLYTFVGPSGNQVIVSMTNATSGRLVEAEASTIDGTSEFFSNNFERGDRIEIYSNGKMVSWFGFTANAGTLSTESDAEQALGKVDDALTRASSQRSKIGGKINLFEHELNHITSTRDTLEKANSRIRDVDTARESARKAEAEIVLESSRTMLTQANIFGETALGLIRNGGFGE